MNGASSHLSPAPKPIRVPDVEDNEADSLQPLATPSGRSSLLNSISRHSSYIRSLLVNDPAAQRAVRISGQDLDASPFTPLSCQPTPLQQFVESLGDTFLVARLALLLWSYLGPCGRWFFKFLCLLMYTCFLLPGFIQMGMFYFGSSRVLRSITYGPNPRNRLDLYVPRNHWRMESGPRPVVIYITGGAWMIGYKAWGSLLGRRLSKQGVLVCCLDYRNFPQGTITDMLEDVNTGIAWVLSRCGSYGGDTSRVYLVGQSCGAQLGTLALITQAEQEAQEGHAQLPGGHPPWSPQAIKGLMKLLSPTYCVKGVHWGHTLPSVLLLHGTADTCAPLNNAVQFAEALREAGANVEVKWYDGQTHTSPLIENPMRGHDVLTDDILSWVMEDPNRHTNQFPLCPAVLIGLAALVCPF
ncbi:hypothetical protein WJX73_000658 [Symbiochloris irregularis]|uniref:protein-S-isoprenylcysteine alpha-carbonyl methylesterase n=1 Tax=Symbiochloris irregularis TaxID=706552 RepID=A0AAW1P033_9CHLO